MDAQEKPPLRRNSGSGSDDILAELGKILQVNLHVSTVHSPDVQEHMLPQPLPVPVPCSPDSPDGNLGLSDGSIGESTPKPG